MMNDKLDWTQKLGDAFLAQQNDVMDAVQRLRARAEAAGNLKSTRNRRSRGPVGRRGRPAALGAGLRHPAGKPHRYYVPIYDPSLVYGAWPYPTYRPFYWYPPGYVAAGVFALHRGLRRRGDLGQLNWWNRRVDVNVNRYNSFNRTSITSNNWKHNAAHRGSCPTTTRASRSSSAAAAIRPARTPGRT